ncbi:MAG TPA: glycosyltransferase, partial [Ktedonobacteraceae bacterium]
MQQTGISLRMNEPEVETQHTPSPKVDISIVVPVMNEEKSVGVLFERVSEQVAQLQKTYEIIFVDDGSTDATFSELQKLYAQYQDIVRVVRFRRNFGKTPALVAGFSRARGDIIFTMDG